MQAPLDRGKTSQARREVLCAVVIQYENLEVRHETLPFGSLCFSAEDGRRREVRVNVYQVFGTEPPRTAPSVHGYNTSGTRRGQAGPL